MGKMQRTKGASFERLMANRLQHVYPDARRGIGQARSAKEVPDVDKTPFWVECKHGKCPNLWRAIEQAQEATDGRPPLVIARRNGGKELAVLEVDAFIQILADLEDARKAMLHWSQQYHALLKNGDGRDEETPS